MMCMHLNTVTCFQYWRPFNKYIVDGKSKTNIESIARVKNFGGISPCHKFSVDEGLRSDLRLGRAPFLEHLVPFRA